VFIVLCSFLNEDPRKRKKNTRKKVGEVELGVILKDMEGLL
jgi:hypothetical protein